MLLINLNIVGEEVRGTKIRGLTGKKTQKNLCFSQASLDIGHFRSSIQEQDMTSHFVAYGQGTT